MLKITKAKATSDISQLRKIGIILDLVRENMEGITDTGNNQHVSGAQVFAMAWLVRFCVEEIEKLTEGKAPKPKSEESK